MALSSKLPNVGTTIFTVMSALANEHGAINLSQGFPGYPIDPELSELVNQNMRAGFNQYTPMGGDPGLKRVLSYKHEKLFGKRYNPASEICVTAGATQGLFTAITALIHPGDEVILFTPAYDSYIPSIEVNRGVPVVIEMSAPNYRIPWDQVREKITPRTRMIMINSPHNPTGSVIDQDDLNELAAATRDTDIIVLSDEVYEHITFDGITHASVSGHEELAERSLVVFSFGKTFHVTGWKTGYTLAPSHLMTEFFKVHQFNVFSCNNPMQKAIAQYMQEENTYLNLPAFFQKKRDYFLEGLKDSRFKIVPARGTYFQLLDYSAISDEGDVDLAKRWTKEKGIASIPVSVFHPSGKDEKVLRFCFAKQEDELAKGIDILRSL